LAEISVPITTATVAEWSSALELALEHLGEDTRPARVRTALSLLADGTLDPEGVFVARAASGLRGVQICVPLPGASGLFWLPKSAPPDADLEDRMVQYGLDWLRRRGTKLAQIMLSRLDIPSVGPLIRTGFRHITQLQYFEHALKTLPQQSASSLNYITYSEGQRGLFQTTLLRTYEETLDCPELNDVRTIDEIIAGLVGQGVFCPERWWLAMAHGQPVAVALLSEISELNAWDLSYLGVVPEARRRGIGREITTHILHYAQSSHCPKMILGVDERNQPALQLYRELGFLYVDSREVYLYFWPPPLATEPS
jgi:mycothiol synthase